MKLFDLKLGNELDGAAELFMRGASYDRECGCALIKSGSTASFGTYFNLFPSAEYAEFCGAEKVFLNISAEGEYRLDFYCQPKYDKPVLLKSASAKGDSRTVCDFGCVKRGGYSYFSFTALTDCRLKGGFWETEKESDEKVKIGIVICTYKREKFVAENIRRLVSAIVDDPSWSERLHVYIIDNASSLQLSESRFYTVVQNRNSGGSGGFARGMTEILKNSSFTHFLLMDDDIFFDFNVISRTYYLLCALKDEYRQASVGGAMLKLEKPCIQHEFGGIFKGLIFKSVNSGLDMRETANLIKNQNAPKADYNAWWYCCMPVSAIKKYGLPMPFFIKADDVEYGMRAIETLILMSGIAVWHQDFADKYTGTLEYYIKRNAAVAAALRCKSGGLKAATRFAYFMFKNLSLKNYECVELIHKAYHDFKKGCDFFLETDPVILNDEIRSHAQPFERAEELEKFCGFYPVLPQTKIRKRRSLISAAIMLIENFLPSFFFSEKIAVTDAGRPRASDCFLRKTVVHYDEKNRKGFICRLDTVRRRKLRRESIKVCLGLMFYYGRIKKNYSEGYRKVCSKERWNEIFFGQTGNHEK